MGEKKSKPMKCVYCGKGERKDEHCAGFYIQWTCEICGRAQCQQLEPADG